MRSLLLLLAASFTLHLHAQEICDNGLDDDADSLIDLNDTADCTCGEIPVLLEGILPNPSFEEYECIPQSYTELYCCEGWDQGTFSTADYFRVEGYMPAWIPQPLPGNGNACVGGYYCIDYMEYVGTCLLAPLDAGTNYTLDLQMMSVFVDNFLSSTTALDLSPVNVTVYGLSTCPSFPTGIALCPASEGWTDIGHVTYTPSNAWNPVSIELQSPFDVQAIMIGSPCTLPADYPHVFDPWLAYFLMDELSISTSGSPGAPITGEGNWCDGDLVVTAHPDSSASSYQWYQDGIAIPGATDTVLAISALSLDSGDYVFSALGDTSCALSSFHVGTEITPPPYIALTSDGLWCPLPGSYQWFFNGEPIPGATSEYHLPEASGTYTVQLTNALGCSMMSYPFDWLSTVIAPAASQGLALTFAQESATLMVQGVPGPLELLIVDATGRVVRSERIKGPSFASSLAQLASGVYIARVADRSLRFVR